METSIVNGKGQVVFPSRIRKKHKIKNGTKIQFIDEGNEIRMVAITSEIIDSNFGFLRTKGKLLKALMDEKKVKENYEKICIR